MKHIELTPRMQAIADLISSGSIVADIGTDHAYLPVWLLLEGKVSRAIAADLREGPLSRAKATAQQYECKDGLSFRLCDGLAGIDPREADTIVIAGMGGETIAAILERAPWTADKYYTMILQPMSAQPELRRWLWSRGYCIQEEQLVCEGEKLYTIFLVRYGQITHATPAEEWAGRQAADMVQPLRQKYLELLLNKVDRAMDGIAQGKRGMDDPRLTELAQLKQALLEMKKEWEVWQQ